jgi:hypothetical protein
VPRTDLAAEARARADHDRGLLEQAKDEAKSDQESRCKLDRSSRAWRNGRRAGFRSRWGNPWGFESPRSHTLLTRSFALHLLSPAWVGRSVVNVLSTGRAGSWSPSPRISLATVSAASASRPGST